MKKVFLVFAIFLASGFWGVNSLKSLGLVTTPGVSPVVEVLSEQTKLESTPVPEIYQGGLPKTLIIPKLGVNTTVEHVGMNAKGAMDVPKVSANAAWYNLGHMVGSQGSAVLAGHFDREDGSPAVFYRLEELDRGDEIKVQNEDGKELSFRVTKKETYDFDKVPLQEVFDSTDKIRLNLITCEGVFNKLSKNYSKRLVVYSELQNP